MVTGFWSLAAGQWLQEIRIIQSAQRVMPLLKLKIRISMLYDMPQSVLCLLLPET
jgi:hypothetical protein